MIRRLFTEIAAVYDRMNHLLSLGRDHLWRRRAARLVSVSPRRIIDLACGTGDFAFALADAYPAAIILGLDLTPAMLTLARRKNSYANVSFAEGDAEHPDLPSGKFDLVACAFGFRNFQDRATALRHTRRLLAPRGELLVLEFFRPSNHLLGALTRCWLALMTRLFAPAHRCAYDYLDLSMRSMLTEDDFVALAGAAGLNLRHRRFFFPCCSALLFDSVR